MTKEGPTNHFCDSSVITEDNLEGLGAVPQLELNQAEVLHETPAVCQRFFCADDPDLPLAEKQGLLEVDQPVEDNIPQKDAAALNAVHCKDWGHDKDSTVNGDDDLNPAPLNEIHDSEKWFL